MSQASNSDNELKTAPEVDPSDSGSVWKPSKAAKAPVPLLVQRPQQRAQKKKERQAQISISKVMFYLN